MPRKKKPKKKGVSKEKPRFNENINFELHSKFLEGVNQIFELFRCDQKTKEFLESVLLCKNSTILLSGVYGTGKSLLIHLIGQTFFSDSFSVTRFRDTLTEFDTLLSIDIAKLNQGIEEISPRPIITSHLKWINEIQRGNPKLYNALLSLLAEHEVEYRAHTFKSPNFLCFMDRNSKDVASAEIPRALFDRIDYSIDIPVISMKESYNMLTNRFTEEYIEDLRDKAHKVLESAKIEEIWNEAEKVFVPQAIILYLNLIGGLFSNCIKVDRSTLSPKYNIDIQCDQCEFKGEICSNLKEILGERWKISALKLAKSHAWIDKRNKTNLDDLNFAITYTLPHRLQLKGNIYANYPNEYEWVKENLRKVLTVKKRIWLDAINAFSQLLDGTEQAHALEHLKKLSIRDLSIHQLYQWADQIYSE
ncbi:MAG: AAA family ATPase [Candidatus Helarchaeota archaeon]